MGRGGRCVGRTVNIFSANPASRDPGVPITPFYFKLLIDKNHVGVNKKNDVEGAKSRSKLSGATNVRDDNLVATICTPTNAVPKARKVRGCKMN